MVELIALSVIVVIAILAILTGVPRYLARSNEGGETYSHTRSWPDILGWLDSLAIRWMAKSRAWHIGLGIITIVLLAVAVVVYQDPGIIGPLEDQMEFVAHSLAVLGLSGLFASTYLNVRRAGLYSAEATLVGMSLTGTVLMILIVAALVS